MGRVSIHKKEIMPGWEVTYVNVSGVNGKTCNDVMLGKVVIVTRNRVPSALLLPYSSEAEVDELVRIFGTRQGNPYPLFKVWIKDFRGAHLHRSMQEGVVIVYRNRDPTLVMVPWLGDVKMKQIIQEIYESPGGSDLPPAPLTVHKTTS